MTDIDEFFYDMAHAIVDISRRQYEIDSKTNAVITYLRSLKRPRNLGSIEFKVHLRDAIRRAVYRNSDPRNYESIQRAFLNVFKMDINYYADNRDLDGRIHDTGPRIPEGQSDMHYSDPSYHSTNLRPEEMSYKPDGPGYQGMQSLFSMVEDLSTAVRDLETHVQVKTQRSQQVPQHPH